MTQLPIPIIDLINDYVQPNINDILLSRFQVCLNNTTPYWKPTYTVRMVRVTNTRITHTSYPDYRSKPFFRGIFSYYVRV